MAQRILVQAGHLPPLQPGHEGETGEDGEKELVTAIRDELCRILRGDDRFRPVPMPGKIDEGIETVAAALFLHADGFDDPSANGFSVGYPAEFDVNRRLAHLVAEEFMKLPGHPRRREDNQTPDRAQYYGFSHVATPGPEVLVEHGFLTNPDEANCLRASIKQLAHAEYVALCRHFGFRPQGAPAPPPPPTGGRLTVGSRVLGAATVPARKPQRFLLARDNGAYTDDDVVLIVGNYYKTARAVGMDPLVAIAQMSLETAHLSSDWSQRPRRNLAGIGVTGEPGVGEVFPNLRVAVRAHVGRLLAYAVPIGAESRDQLRLIREALAVRPLPDEYRGAAPTLKGLVGRWASDPDYAKNIAAIANGIRAAT